MKIKNNKDKAILFRRSPRWRSEATSREVRKGLIVSLESHTACASSGRTALSGSCLLLVTLISSVILIFALNTWNNIILSSDLVRKKYEYEFNFRMLEGLHNFGIFKCINNYHKISDPKFQKRKKKNSNKGTIMPIVLYKGHWPIEYDLEQMKLTNDTHYDSIILLTTYEEFSVINSKLINKKTGEAYSMESKIKKIKKEYLLYDWQF